MPQTLRRVVFWAHLITGIVASAVILMMSVTGVILTYEMQLNKWAMGDYRAAPSPGSSPLAIESLLEEVEKARPEGTVTSFTLAADALEPLSVRLGRERMYVDRYSGDVLGDGSGATRHFLREVMYWHRWFAMTGDNRAIGKAVTGAANAGFLFLVLSGFFLWWPRSWTPAALRRVTWFDGALTGKARDYNWHNVIGFWTCVPLVVIVAGGIVISYPTARNLLYTLTGSELPGSAPKALAEERPTPRRGVGQPVSLEEIMGHAASEVPGWRTMTVQLGESKWEPVAIALDTSPGRQPHKRVDLMLDSVTCDVVSRKTSADYSVGRRLRSWFRFAHTGEVYGVVGQTIAGVATAGAAVLVWTGLALAWRRFFGRS